MRIFRYFPTALLAIALLVLVAPVGASAQSQIVPPGNSVTDQYTETFPWVSGDRTDPDGRRDPREGLGERNLERLEQAAEEGEEIAAVLASTGPQVASAALNGGGAGGATGNGSSGGSAPSGGGAQGGEGTDRSGSATTGEGAPAITGAATGLAAEEGSISALLSFLLITALVALIALATALWRARSRPSV